MTITLNDQLVALLSLITNMKLDIPMTGYSLPILDVLFAILINYSYRSALGVNHTKIGWYQGLLATLVMATGGGCTVSILRGEPVGVLKSNEFWFIHGSTYIAMFSNPYVYQFIDMLFSIPGLEHVFTLSDSVLRANAMIQNGIDGVITNPDLGQDKIIAKIICGTLAGCGGAIWIDAFRLNQPLWAFSTPRLLHVPSMDMKVSFMSTLFYLASSSPSFCEYINMPVLNPLEAQAWTTLLLSTGLVYASYSDKIAVRREMENKLEKKE